MDKYIKDGKVAVLFSPCFGAGWYTWHDKLELVFDPTIVQFVLDGKLDKIEGYVEKKYPDEYVCTLGVNNLCITWLPEGTQFYIDEYDGSESVITIDRIDFITA